MILAPLQTEGLLVVVVQRVHCREEVRDLWSLRLTHMSKSQDSHQNISLRTGGSLLQAAACPPCGASVQKETCAEMVLSGEIFGWDSSHPDARHLQDWCLDLG